MQLAYGTLKCNVIAIIIAFSIVNAVATTTETATTEAATTTTTSTAKPTAVKKSNCPRMKRKAEWGGKLANSLAYQVRPIRYVVIHHTATESCRNFAECAEAAQSIQHYHMSQQKFDDIGYNFLIGNDGVVYEGRGWDAVGAHTRGYNVNGTGIAFIGTYHTKLPARAALNAAKKLLSCGVKNGDLMPSYGLLAATQVSATKSPGLMLYNEIQKWDNWVPEL